MTKGKRKRYRTTIISTIILICMLVMVGALSACTRQSNNNSIDDGIKEEVASNQEENKEGQDKDSDIKLEEATQVKEDPIKEDNPESELNEVPQGSDGEKAFDYTVDSSGLSNKGLSWSFKRNSTHTPVIGYNQGIELDKYDAHYKVDTEEKVIYLTFDEGYENGYTATILDILLENDVQAAFFVTKPYIESSTDLSIRMKEEGHIVANHSVTHSSFPELSNDQIKEELEQTAQAFYDATGYNMDLFFRTPSGNFSERVLNEVRNQGYSSIFWSLAYVDWDVNKQPGAEYVYNHIMENYHPGGIFLLHAVSQSNTEALDRVLKALKQEGYRFGSLYELE
ncbi:MAG: hypothetical protein CVV02_16055 [Firmicutes bacterium HGW-Firmicutes-7]|nr:MAG: hypothetical protein CVV02_16055 [Firmicutes bacterium HGW-Firmicutes-7]